MAIEKESKTVGGEVRKTLGAAAIAIAALLAQTSAPANSPTHDLIERAKQQSVASSTAQPKETPAPLVLKPSTGNELLADHFSHSSHSSHSSHRSHYSSLGASGGSGGSRVA